MTDTLLNLAEDNIPRRSVTIHKSTHPWLTERGEEAVRRKYAAQGSTDEAKESIRMQRNTSGRSLRLPANYAVGIAGGQVCFKTTVVESAEDRRSQAESIGHSSIEGWRELNLQSR